MKNKIVLFDIDHTLFNTVKFVEGVYQKNSQNITRKDFYEFLNGIKIGLSDFSGSNSIENKILQDLWSDAASENNLYDETKEVLSEISKQALLGIYSKGDKKYQETKIQAIKHFFKEENIHIAEDKYIIFSEIARQYGNYQIFVVDDILEVLFAAKQTNKDVCTILVKRPVYAEAYLKNQAPIESFSPDLIVNNLSEIIPFIS